MHLGLDLGTSSVKTVIVDASEVSRASAEVPLAPRRPQPPWSEDDPGAWWAGVATALDRQAETDAARLARWAATGEDPAAVARPASCRDPFDRMAREPSCRRDQSLHQLMNSVSGVTSENVTQLTRVTDVIPPEPRLADAHAPRLVAFRSLYAALKSEFSRLA